MMNRLDEGQKFENKEMLKCHARSLLRYAQRIWIKVHGTDASYGQINDDLKDLYRIWLEAEAVNDLLKADYVAKLRGERATEKNPVVFNEMITTHDHMDGTETVIREYDVDNGETADHFIEITYPDGTVEWSSKKEVEDK